MKKIIIAIDGFSSTGKSTIAKMLAKKLDYIYVDTGAMYRAVTLYAIENKWISEEHFEVDKLIEALVNIQLRFVFNPASGIAEIHLNDINVENSIRSLKVSKQVSKVATISQVRSKLVEQQQAMGKDSGIVMDGRNIGTVVFPNANVKLFLTASADKRAVRRYKELLDKGENVSYEDVLENVKYRDHIDATRKDSPLKIAKGAIEIDNSDMGLEEQFERIYSRIKTIILEYNNHIKKAF